MNNEAKADLDVLIVGAGVAGLFMLYRLRSRGFKARVYEAGGDVGGTWYWNRYPGARCDTESVQYSYQFSEELQQEWEWSERYASQPEILRYVEHVAERFDLRRDIVFNTRIVSAVFNEEASHWVVETDGGERISATFCVMATGCLSSPNIPAFDGLDDFDGPVFHTGLWPHEKVDFTGKRVGVIGTGSSAMQSIPIIAREADEVFVFQRTAHYAVPAHNGPINEERVREVKANYPEIRARAKKSATGFDQTFGEKEALKVGEEEREREFEKRWAHGGLPFLSAFTDLRYSEEANQMAGEFVRNKIRSVVKDPKTAELLCPTTVIGCKRLCVVTEYYEVYNRPNVHLIDVSESPIEKITPEGIMTAGRVYDIDTLILATGFDAMTGTLLRIDIRGRGGRTLQDKWKEGPRTYLGLMTAGFPNMFTITGPGSPSVLTNMQTSIDHHVEWIGACLVYLRENGMKSIEATVEAEGAWVAHNNEETAKTIRYQCTSWYLGANIPGKPRVFMPYIAGFDVYSQKCRQIVEAGYEGFRLSRNEEAVPCGSELAAPEVSESE